LFQTKVVEEIKTPLMFNNVFPESQAVYEIMWKNTVESAHAHCVLDNQGYSHTLRIRNTPVPLQQWLRHLAAMLRYTYVACIELC